MTTTLSRRRFLSTALGAAALSAPFAALEARALAQPPTDARRKKHFSPDYGPLAPVRDHTTGLPLLWLPRGFEYVSYGWTGDRMDDGLATPSAHDGMAAFRRGDRVHLVRNHERGERVGAFVAGPYTYDARSGGGTTTLVFDPDAGAWVESYASLAGTVRNCAGGPTPWGTWLTCEETFLTDGPDATGSPLRHGYVFEVPAEGVSDATPLTGLGRFSHEAAAVDPTTGIVYLTEDRGDSRFYRFVPNQPGRLAAGGRLEAMVLHGTVDTAFAAAGDSWAVSWAPIANPDPATESGAGVSVRQQGGLRGAARIVRGEGCWYGNDLIYVVSTSGGAAGEGQIFALDPTRQTFTCIFASPSAAVLDNPDNIAVSPRGGIVLCEDGDNDVQALHGLTPDGEIFRFAENHVVLAGERNGIVGSFTGSEWAGATFEPKKGNWLFVNIQTPGITFAITGPWKQGAL
jgi:secreted PhoX family phosphatase